MARRAAPRPQKAPAAPADRHRLLAGRPIVFHTVAHARAAAAAAAALGTTATLLTAPGAHAYAGPLYLGQLVEAALAEWPQAGAIDAVVLDCGDDSAIAYAALRAGWRDLLFTGRPGPRQQVAGAAESAGVRLYTRAARALDLLDHGDARAACTAWLQRSRRRSTHVAT